jgi:uncharacterized protein
MRARSEEEKKNLDKRSSEDAGSNAPGVDPVERAERTRPLGRRVGAGGNPLAIRGAALGKSGVSRSPASAGPGTQTLVDMPSTEGRPTDQRPEDPQDLAVPSPDPSEGGRNRIPTNWKRALGIGVLCFVVWLVLDAPTLMTNAEGSPLGVRRTVAMDFLRPIAWLSRETGLSHIVGAADRILGRSGSGAVAISSGPTPSKSVTGVTIPPPTTVVTTKTGQHITKPVLLPDGFPPFPPFSAANPLRVLIVGDSVGTDLGEYALVDDLGSTNVVSAILDGHISTGLTRPDYFNWPAELEVDLARYHPELVIVCIGANDAQADQVNGQTYVYGTQAWDNMYSARVGAFISEATTTGAHVLWVGMPPMASSQLNAQMEHLDYLYATQVSRHVGSTYMSSVPALGGPAGQYEAIKNVDGTAEEIRTDDGIHLQPAGAQLLAEAVIQEMDQVYRLKLKP